MGRLIYHGDCLDILRTLADNCFDAVVTDPPYGLAFMGKRWDYDVPSQEIWAECLRVLKPGGHLLAFAGTRTQHRMTVRIEDAGFEIRDMIAWVYGSGFPKSLDVSKAIDKAAGAERAVVGTVKKLQSYGHEGNNCFGGDIDRGGVMQITSPATDAARQWQGWGTALKPALEPITVARKPLTGTVSENVQRWGCGALNIDASRVGNESTRRTCNGVGASSSFDMAASGERRINGSDKGRWPANLIHDGTDEVVGLFPVTTSGKDKNTAKTSSSGFTGNGIRTAEVNYGDTGSAARFFYCAKASKRDRDDGVAGVAGVAGVGALRDGGRPSQPRKNIHPTVKPTDLMRYLVRLVTPPGGTVLDPFAGSGSTGKACALEGFGFIGIEREAEYVEIARARIEHARQDMPQMELAV